MMMQWCSDYDSGIYVIDQQHKQLINIANELDCLHRSKLCTDDGNDVEKQEMIESNFLKLINYCNYHFTIEELAMEKCKYMRRELHKATHDKFVTEIHGLYRKYHRQDCLALRYTVDFLYDWLVDHIMGEDRRYVSVLAEVFANDPKFKSDT